MHRERGITLIEVLVVVIIVGILAAQAIPQFRYSATRTHQKEALSVLKQIYVMQRAYFVEHERYYIPPAGTVASATDPQAFQSLSIEIIKTGRYSYTIESAGNGFVAWALASDLDEDAAVDEWKIDNMGVLAATSDDAES